MTKQKIPSKFKTEEEKLAYTEGYKAAMKEAAKSAMTWLRRFGFGGLYNRENNRRS